MESVVFCKSEEVMWDEGRLGIFIVLLVHTGKPECDMILSKNIAVESLIMNMPQCTCLFQAIYLMRFVTVPSVKLLRPLLSAAG